MARRTLLALLALFLAGCAGSGGSEETGATVERVVDGDTLVLTDGLRVRLVQIDAPESGEECYAEQSAAALERLVPPGSQVALEGDPALDDVDRFGRLLRYVVRDGRNVNVELVRAGAAAPWFFDGDRGLYADDLLDAVEAARSDRRGLWRACPGTRLDPSRGIETAG